MAVVVTGSSGFIGSQLVAALAERGERVVGIDRSPAGGGATIVTDLSDPSMGALEALGTAEVVWHLAARPGVRDQRRDIRALRHRDNVVATERVLEAVPAGTLVVVASSSSVYGGSIHQGRERACREDDPLRPRGGYAISKHAAEMLCARRASRGGRVAIARPFTVAGEHQRPDMAIATWISSIAAGQPITLFGSPTRTRDISDVRDVVRGFLAIAERGVSGIFNLGSGVGHTLEAMVAAVSAALDAPVHIKHAPARADEVAATLADTTLCETELGTSFSSDLEELVRRQIRASGVAIHTLEEVG